jgi:thiol-disulfide isomerase/thioredoxin
MTTPDSRQTPSDPAAVRSMRRWIALLGGAMLLLAAALAAMPWLAGRPWQAPSVSFTMIDGSQPTLQSLQGRPVLVSFWSTTCAPCMEEMPSLIAFQREFAARGLVTVAVAMKHDRPDMVIDLAQRRALPFRVALDVQGEAARAFRNTEATPTKFLIDASGQVVRTYVGHTDFGDLEQRVKALLAG